MVAAFKCHQVKYAAIRTNTGQDIAAMKWLWCQVVVIVVAVTQTRGQDEWHNRTQDGGDMHGGVQMGVFDDRCDNAKDHLEVDWDNSIEDYKCMGSTYTNEKDPATVQPAHCTTLADPPLHICLPEPIAYRDPMPTSGAHRPLWAKFGEYQYLPKQRWLHNLEHGCAVFLYHPCADPKQVQEMRDIANLCLRKHIITPLKELSRETPFAVLTYGCKLLLPYINANRIVEFLRDHALDAPESRATGNGQYGVGLERSPAQKWDDISYDICINFPQNDEFDELAAIATKIR